MKNAPTFIVFETTTDCNLSCRYCYNIWKRPGAKHSRLNSYAQSMATLKRLFKQTELARIAMTGGEPLLAERFAEVALYCRMQGKAVTVISNGNSDKRDDYQTLLGLGVSLFEFPVHAARPEPHDALTGVAGSWACARRSICDVLDLGGEVVAVIVLTKLNCAEIGATLDYVKSLGVRRVMLARFNVGGAGIANRRDLQPSLDELRSAFSTANGMVGKELLISSNVCTPHCVVDPRDYPRIACSNCSTDAAKRPLTIDITGNVRLCNHSPIVAGNIHRTPLSEIIACEYFASWNTVPQFCSDCARLAKCLGGCRAASEQLGLPLTAVDPYVTAMNIEKPQV